MSSKAKTVRVRIAVAVNDLGQWRAEGFDEYDDKHAIKAATSTIEGERRVFWVEADLPIPETQVVEGEVKHVD